MIENENSAESYRRKMAWKRTPQENMDLFCELQRQAFETLQASPEAMDHFIRRNHRKRRQSEVQKFLHSRGFSDQTDLP